MGLFPRSQGDRGKERTEAAACKPTDRGCVCLRDGKGCSRNAQKDRRRNIKEDCFRDGKADFINKRKGEIRLRTRHAKGKYHINIDSDTMYPPKYVELMVNALERPGIVAVCSLWSYIPDETHPWLGLKVYETARDVHLWMQSFKRPELSVRGLVFAYRTEYAKRTGIRTDIIR